MADTKSIGRFNPYMHIRMSRLGEYTRATSHSFAATPLPLPSNAVELVYSLDNRGIHRLIENIKDYGKHPPHKNKEGVPEIAAGGLTIFMGSLTPTDVVLKSRMDQLLNELDYVAVRRSRNILLVPSRKDVTLDSLFDRKSIYRYEGYLDYGIDYSSVSSPKNMVGIAQDVTCFWDSDNSNATVIIPDVPTIGGMLRAKTVMRKADIMVSYNPPYEVLEGFEDNYTQQEIKDSLLVSEARQIWDPVIHYYGGAKERSKLVSADGRQMLSLSYRRDSPVVRWSRGDLEKGPISGPGGYPINERIYKVK